MQFFVLIVPFRMSLWAPEDPCTHWIIPSFTQWLLHDTALNVSTVISRGLIVGAFTKGSDNDSRILS
jgi:hypothetical protein